MNRLRSLNSISLTTDLKLWHVFKLAIKSRLSDNETSIFKHARIDPFFSTKLSDKLTTLNVWLVLTIMMNKRSISDLCQTLAHFDAR